MKLTGHYVRERILQETIDLEKDVVILMKYHMIIGNHKSLSRTFSADRWETLPELNSPTV